MFICLVQYEMAGVRRELDIRVINEERSGEDERTRNGEKFNIEMKMELNGVGIIV